MTEVLHVSWADYQDAVEHLAQLLRPRATPDLIVGIARGGLPLAVSLSHVLEVRTLGVALVSKSYDDRVAAELRPVDDIDFGGTLLPGADTGVHQVLLVDDIAAKGDVFHRLRLEIDQQLGTRAVYHHATLFADTASIGRGSYRALLGQLDFVKDVDNDQCWVRFPWERDG